MKWFALFLLACAALFAAPGAQATTTCTITSFTGLSFGPVDPTGTTVDINGTMNYSCTYNGVLGALFGSYISLCASLGPDDLGNIASRTMLNSANTDRMQYQVYRDSARTAIWGNVNNTTYPAQPFTMFIGLLSNGAVVSGSLPVFGRVPVGQTGLSPGSYLATLSGNTLTYSYNEALLTIGVYPTTCSAGGTVAAQTVAAPAMTVTASVAPKCTVGTATDLNFGSIAGLLRTNSDQTSLLRLTCTNRAAYQVGLDNGQNASGTTRRMAMGSRYVTYELYKNSQRSQRWGNTLNSDTQAGSGSGVEQTLTVFGRVPAQAAVAAGDYSDKITVTVTY